MTAKFLGSNGLFCFISICKFGSFKNHFATITSLSELYFRFRRFIMLVQTKIMVSINYGSSTSCWKSWRWVRFDLILTMRDIYINSNLIPFVEPILASEERKKFKRAGLWESQPGIRVGTLTISVRSFENITKFTRSTSSTKIGLAVLMMDVQVSKDKHISRWVDRENLIYVRWNRIKAKTVIDDEEGVRHWVK